MDLGDLEVFKGRMSDDAVRIFWLKRVVTKSEFSLTFHFV